jgi:hypothetical protein
VVFCGLKRFICSQRASVLCPKPVASCFSRQWVFVSCCSGVWRRALRRWESADAFMEESSEQWRTLFFERLYTKLYGIISHQAFQMCPIHIFTLFLLDPF